MNKNIKIVGVQLLAMLSACTSLNDVKEGSTSKLFTKLDAQVTGIDFVNEIENQKDFNIFKYRNFYNGGGVAIGDINNDGLPDIYMTANMKPNKLYLNKGDFRFEDISERAGVSGNKPWSTGVMMVDVNSDGLLDIYVSNAGNLEGNNHDNDLYINNGDLTFSERASEYNLAKTGFSTHASFFDYDKDGDLDAYILNNSNIPVSSLGYAGDREKRAQDWDVPDIFKGVGDMLMRNDDGRFVDVSEEAGIYGSLIGFGLGVYVTDINQDLHPDIYVSNDFYERDYLYINNQDGTFTESIKDWTSHLCLSAMGVDMADINNDGLNDIFITDMMPEKDERIKSVMEFEGYNVFKLKQDRDFYQQYIQNTLQLNNGNGTFSEIAYYSGVAKTDWSWAGLMFDMDNDSYKDIYVTNGIIHDLTDIDFVDFFANEIVQETALTGKKEEISEIIEKMPVVALSNYAYRNNGDLTFSNVSADWGLEIPSFSNGCAYGDLDLDGDLDIVVNNVNMPAFLFRNESSTKSQNNYLRINLKGDAKNPFAIGASVRAYVGEKVIFQEMMPSRGFQSSVEYALTLGLGQAQKIDSLRVLWPNDQISTRKNIKVNQTILFDIKNAKQIAKDIVNQAPKLTLLSELSNSEMNPHQENLFNDFDHEGLIGKKLSQEGPCLAIADVNGDGHEDIYLGGAKGQSGTLYLHLGEGKLKVSYQKDFVQDEGFEDTAASFFDADGDGDQDLIVGSGGNEITDKSYYVSRIYLNNGSGEFKRSSIDPPYLKTNISVIAPYDFDADGDTDLFIGSRSVPGVYGIDPGHLLLINNGDGKFEDRTERLAYDIKDAGMVTDALWVDVDGDKRADLITVAEWATPMLFMNSGRRLIHTPSSLDSLSGWWNTISTADIDNDGDPDLILGNQGLNVPYQASKDSPMRMYINDFDNNGTIEQIITTRRDGGDYPLHMRKEITGQMPHLKKENLKASDYARRTIQQLFSEEVIKSALIKTAEISETIVAVNDGGGKYSMLKLPERTQFSCVCGISCEDVNNDGNIDLIMAGNNFELKPQFSRQDANYGNVLLGDGKLGFKWMDYESSGFFVREEVKHVKTYKDKSGKSYLIAAVNDGAPKVYKINN